MNDETPRIVCANPACGRLVPWTPQDPESCLFTHEDGQYFCRQQGDALEIARALDVFRAAQRRGDDEYTRTRDDEYTRTRDGEYTRTQDVARWFPRHHDCLTRWRDTVRNIEEVVHDIDTYTRIMHRDPYTDTLLDIEDNIRNQPRSVVDATIAAIQQVGIEHVAANHVQPIMRRIWCDRRRQRAQQRGLLP